jgi:Protein of unknwon function (DUF3310)
MTDRSAQPFDPVNKPVGYNSHPSKVETVQVTEHLSAMLGSAVKYVWRHPLKGNPVQDLRKASWCFSREAERVRNYEDASLWDGNYWRAFALKAAAHDDTVLGDVLRVLLEVKVGVKDWGACYRMAVLCDVEADRLERERAGEL